MISTQMKNNGRLSSGFKKLLFGGIALGMAASTWATIIPQPQICITDLTGTPVVNTVNLAAIDDGTPPVITPGVEQVNVQLFINPTDFPLPLGTSYVILTVGGTADFVIKYNLSVTGPSQDSLNLFFADYTSPNFASVLGFAQAASATTIAATGAQQDLSQYLDGGSEFLDVCVECGFSTPDTTPTWPLLGLAVVGIVSMRRFIPGLAKSVR